jgi:hypothetical protein
MVCRFTGRVWGSVTVVSLAISLVACATGGSEQTPTADAAGGPDGASAAVDAGTVDQVGEPDASVPDAAIPPSAVVSLSPGVLAIARGGAGMLTVTLDQPAVAGGAVVLLESDDPGGSTFSIPSQVTVPEGEIQASFAVSSVAVGGPFDVRATFGASVQTSSVLVVPALVSVGPQTSSDVLFGTTATFVVTFEENVQTAVSVDLTTTGAGLITIPGTVTIPANASSATFPVTGAALGGPVTINASIGSVTVSTSARVVGLFLSEILYDVTGADTMKEWIELYNASPLGIDVTGFRVQVANTMGPYADAMVLSGIVPVGGCVVVGGPLVGSAASNHTPEGFVYFVSADFDPDLGNAGSATGDPGDGLNLVTGSGDVIDNVVYGRNNNDGITDENGLAPTATDVGDAPASQTIERTSPGLGGAWVIQPVPTPADCTPISM